MTRFLAALVLCSVPAAAQTVRAPLSRSVLPGIGTLGVTVSGFQARPALAPMPTAAPILPTAALPQVSAAPVPVVAEGRVKAAAVLESASVPLAKAQGNPSAQAPVLSSLFEGRSQSIAGPVFADIAAAATSRLAPANAARPSVDPAPPTPSRPAWKTAGLYTLRAAGFLGALYGGFRVGDMVYLGAQFLGPFGLLSLPVLGAAAWWLGRRPDASPLGRSVMGGLFGSMGLVVVGQQVWDLVHTPWGLFVGVPVGVALALVASGLLPRRRKFTGEPPNLNRR